MAIIENIENEKYEKKPYKISYGTMTGIGSVVTRVTAVAQVPSLAWELLYGAGMVKKKKKRKEEFPSWLSG